MRKIIIGFCVSLVWMIGITVTNINAQTAWGISIVRYNTETRVVDGYSGTWLDYYAGPYYDPEVIGDLYRTDMNETSLDHGRSFGYSDIIPAEVYLRTTNFVEGRTYCTYSQHAVWGYFYYVATSQWFDPFRYSTFFGNPSPWPGFPFSYYYVFPRRYYLGYTQACIAIPLPPPPTPSPTPTPTPPPATPTPTPTPCNPAVGGTCALEQVVVGVATPIRPAGVSNGTTKAGVWACVYGGIFSGTPIPNRNIDLRLLPVVNSGGHIDAVHSGARPLGRLAKTSGVTQQNGCFYTDYSPSHISGIVTIEARSGGRSDRKAIFVGVSGLIQLLDGTNYRIRGATPEHPSNTWGSAEAVASMPRIADAYKQRYYGSNPMPENDKLRVNEISLEAGGKFDLTPNWNNLSKRHKYHREGNSIDLRCCASPGQIPRNRFAELERLSLLNGATDFLHEFNPEHFHLSFNNEPNNISNGQLNPVDTHTPHSYIDNAWEGALGRFATQNEWEVWHDRLVNAKSQGPSEFLLEVKLLQKYMFAEYPTQRTKEQFISVVFLSHLFREPTEAETQFWLSYYNNLPPVLPLVRKRQRLIDEFQLTQEFVDIVAAIVDGEVIVPPIPTPSPTP